ncbi:MAG: hypothetical protein I3273_02925 [Candidatus Moeniiplasma glomeromycotorum]|nr:hypothetical protein [Candidatus Moeniiplasma glomeromycotorum]MCE8167591.1 hypothetical protein [Candidatus Moeniiplasma glomeromycotorum]MCE8169059.1 hypothetical protein [Candidatus Moeniiplasma glomeromycotorum]
MKVNTTGSLILRRIWGANAPPNICSCFVIKREKVLRIETELNIKNQKLTQLQTKYDMEVRSKGELLSFLSKFNLVEMFYHLSSVIIFMGYE